MHLQALSAQRIQQRCLRRQRSRQCQRPADARPGRIEHAQRRLIVRAPEVGVQPVLAHFMGDPRALAQHPQAVSHVREPLIIGEHSARLHALPRHAPAAIRVRAAAHPQLIAIVDDRHARVRHLEKRRRAHAAHPVCAAGEHPLRVVAGQEAPHGVLNLLRIEHHRAVNARVKLRQAPALLGKELPNRIGKHVVHRPVKHIAQGAPLARIIPALGNEDGLRVLLQHRPAELTPEIGPDLGRHIQPPAIHMRLLQPVAAHLQEICRAFGVLHVQLGHIRPVLTKRHIPARILFPKEKPIVIPGGPPVLQRILKRRKPQPAMIEHAVEHNAHPLLMQRVGKRAQILRGAQKRVDLVVVKRIIAVRRVRKEDRGHVHHAHAQRLEVWHRLQNAPQVAAKAVFIGHAPASPRLHGLLPRHIHAPEAVRKDLVAHTAARPGGLFARGIRMGIVKAAHPGWIIRHGVRTVGIVQHANLLCAQLKGVHDPRVLHGKHRLPDLGGLIAPHALHGHFLVAGKGHAFTVVVGIAQCDLIPLPCAHAQADAHAPIAERMPVLQPWHMLDGCDLQALHDSTSNPSSMLP